MGRVRMDPGLPEQAMACTPSDVTENAVFGDTPANILWVGTSGNVSLELASGALLFHTVAAGSWHSFPPFRRVNSTNTTALNIRVGVTFSK